MDRDFEEKTTIGGQGCRRREDNDRWTGILKKRGQ